MNPGIKRALLQVGDDRVPLLRERRREEPGDHHIDVVFFRADGGGNLQKLRLEILVEEVRHQHLKAEAAGVRFLGRSPDPDLSEQFGLVPLERLRGHDVADRPIIHVGQKRIHRGDAGPIILDFGNQQGMQHILVEVIVRQAGQECGRFRVCGESLRKPARVGHADADEPLDQHAGRKLRLEGGIA